MGNEGVGGLGGGSGGEVGMRKEGETGETCKLNPLRHRQGGLRTGGVSRGGL